VENPFLVLLCEALDSIIASARACWHTGLGRLDDSHIVTAKQLCPKKKDDVIHRPAPGIAVPVTLFGPSRVSDTKIHVL
jgi:hypothetical protein